MKRQVWVLHGASTFASYEAFVEYLKTRPIDLSRDAVKRWKSTLPEALGDGFEVIAPSMPNAQNAKYKEWKIWFERHIPFMHDEVILVGHSMGGIFLAKYLSENVFPKKVLATFLVAAPHSSTEVESLGDFVMAHPLDTFAKQGGTIHFYHSSDDVVVPISELEKYQKELPEAKVTTFSDRGHFDQEQFPELVADLKAL